MTADERKRGLRQAVDAKLSKLPTISRENGEYIVVYIRFLWEIIDSLVDECAVLDEFMQDIEAVGAKRVGHEWPDLLITYNKARIAKGESV